MAAFKMNVEAMERFVNGKDAITQADARQFK